jgi:hypothetical protein
MSETMIGLHESRERWSTRAVAAEGRVEAVLALHKPVEGYLRTVCNTCGVGAGNPERWPCPTVRACLDAAND